MPFSGCRKPRLNVSTDPTPTCAEAGIAAANEINPASPPIVRTRFAVAYFSIAISYFMTLLR
jgi:CO dehydrogenase/acetyl-CoA synthase gamma subunit (corrinoid Fe-S protein)